MQAVGSELVHSGADLLQILPVMRDADDRAAEAAEGRTDDRAGERAEIPGRLVQKQDV